MISLASDLFEYIKLVLRNWVLWIFFILDAIGFVLVYLSPSLKIPYYFYWLLAFLGIFIAGFQVYLNLINKIRSSPIYSMKAAFHKIRASMPTLIEEIKQDLTRPGQENIREFIIIRKSWTVNLSTPCFIYYLDDHENLLADLQVLENYGFIYNISSTKLVRYKFSEDFVSFILDQNA